MKNNGYVWLDKFWNGMSCNFYSSCPKCQTWIEFNKKYIKSSEEPEIIPLDVILQSFDMKIKKWEDENKKWKIKKD